MNNVLAKAPSVRLVASASKTSVRGIDIASRTDVIFRSMALFVILYQFRLLAANLADTAVYTAALFGAFATAIFLACQNVTFRNGLVRKMGPIIALVVIALVPWAIRAFIAMPRLFVFNRTDSTAIALDALLLNFDRNNFVSLLPFYWTAVTTWFALRSRIFLRGAVIADAMLLIAIFTFAPIADIEIYRWPVVVISVIAGVVFLQALALLFSMPKGTGLQKSEKLTAIIILLILILGGALVFLRPAQERAVQRGGGLLEPRGLFSFDFSQVLRLDHEISMSDDLVFIVRKEPSINNALLRRAVMSGYDRRQGFFRIEELDERAHPQRVPGRPTEFPAPDFQSARRVSQEFFLVNFEASAFIGMKQPVSVIPFETWDASSFRAAYAVESMVIDFSLGDFILGRGDAWPTLADFGLSEREFGIYTYYGNDARLRAFAQEITHDHDRFHEKILAIYAHLKFGDYRYSLRPGIAPDGDQLAWFLFYAKRGYCTYFAFAMTLMLRSLGIPARVAAGFLVDPSSSVFNYYAIRADMAHAWVEVLFPGYGWIEFDPTTDRLAEDEEFAFSFGVDPNLFEQLMREILQNRDQMRVRMGPDTDGMLMGAGSFIQASVAMLRRFAPPLILLSLIVTFALIRCGFLLLSQLRCKERKKAISLWNHARRRLRLAGMGCPSSLTESEWALRSELIVKGTYNMYLAVAAARFAPKFDSGDFVAMQNTYKHFALSYRNNVSFWRRFLAWLLPPIALLLPVAPGAGKPSGGKAMLALLILLAFATVHESSAQGVESDLFLTANELLAAANTAEQARNWERAILLYREGSRRFPDDIRFPWALGNLYYGRELYNLALEEFHRAERINPYNPFILQRLASVASFLNLDHAAVAYLERLLEIEPDNRHAISNLGWMYFKVHRLADGERLLTDALERLGDDEFFAMGLGTIYAAMFRYDESKYWYQRAISQGAHSHTFRAVAHHNLSLLESRFFEFGLALDQANASLSANRRASAFLLLGDLQLRRLELQDALASLLQARELDHSPLSKVGLARTHLVSGRLIEARLYAHSSLRVSNHAWMAHYGINPDLYLRDVHELLYNIYTGLAHAERFVPSRMPFQAIASWFRAIPYRFRAVIHRKLFQKYSLASGDAFDRISRDAGGFADIRSWEGSGNQAALPIDRYTHFFNAFRTYPRRAALYLRKARSFETAIIPASISSYDLEEGMLLGNLSMTARALEGFDPIWQRDLITLAYRELARNARTRQARQAFAEELFALNRGALLQSGIALPVEISLRLDGAALTSRDERAFRRALAQAGFAQPVSATERAARFRLNIAIDHTHAEPSASVILIDTETGETTFSRIIPLHSMSRTHIYAFAASLSAAVFRVD